MLASRVVRKVRRRHRRPIREVSLYVNNAFLAHYHKPERARLRGLVRNPAVPAVLLRRLIDEQPKETRSSVTGRRAWSDEQFEILAAHPDREVRVLLAQARYVTPEQRASLVEDPDPRILDALAEGPDWFAWWTLAPEPVLPAWAYERLIERRPRVKDMWLVDNPWLAPELRARLWPDEQAPPAPPQEPPLTRAEAEALARDDNEWVRAGAAADPRQPADLVAALAVDPSHAVRLAVSMRPELSEKERTAVDYHVAPHDRLQPVRWATGTRDPDVQRRCVHSAHIGLRRSVAYNPYLTPDLIAVLAADDDFAVRLLLCEHHADIPAETVLATYLEARTVTSGRLLRHPSFQRVGLARLADSPEPGARALVSLDPEAPPELVERLSHDPHPTVRAWMADDRRLSPGRVLELFDEPPTTEGAAANPRLPVPVMRRILAEAGTLADEVIEGKPTVYLGRWSPDDLPPDEG
jgi:hypothetical protein